MKAMLLILIIQYHEGSYLTQEVEVPVEDHAYCMSIADITGKSIAESLGNYAHSVSTECIKTVPNQRG